MRLQPIIDQLAPVKAILTLGGAKDYAALSAIPGRLPAAFVVPQNFRAAASQRATQLLDQKATSIFAVVLIVGAARAGDVADTDELDALERAVVEQIFGWTHPDANAPTQIVDGAALAVDATAFAWALRFQFTSHFRKVG